MTPIAARHLLSHVDRHRSSLAAGSICLTFAIALGMVIPWLVKHAIDDLNRSVTSEKLHSYALAVLAVSAAVATMRFAVNRIFVVIAARLESELRASLFAQLQSLDLLRVQRYRTGDLVARVAFDTANVRIMVGRGVPTGVHIVLISISAIALMSSIDPWLTAIALIPLPIMATWAYYLRPKLHVGYSSVQGGLSRLNIAAQESIVGVRTMRAYAQERFDFERFARANDAYVEHNRRLIRLQETHYAGRSLLAGLSALLALAVGSTYVTSGRLSLGELVAFNAYVVMLTRPLTALSWLNTLFTRGITSWLRIAEVLDCQPEASRTVRSTTFAIAGTLELRHLSFGYGGPLVLKDICVSIPAGTAVALVGATGSGKSTLLSLIPRLIEPPPGTVFIDGVEVRQIRLEVLRAAIGWVPQSPVLFQGTIADNITFGVASIDTNKPDIGRCARMAGLESDLPMWPLGYATPIGEDGVMLSGGQRQRVALARAIVTHPRIMLLDDPFSAMDAVTDDQIMRRLRAETPGTTKIIACSRVSTARMADQILVIHEGSITERGTHAELLLRNGMYAALYRAQQLEERLATS